MSGISLTCPHCRGTFELREARSDASWQRFLEQLQQLPASLTSPVLRYLDLLAPKQQNFRSTTLLSLIKELVPLIQQQQLKHQGTTYQVPHSLWAETLVYLAEKPDLNTPLKGHGYLLCTLADRAEQAAAKAESAHLEQLRQRPPREAAPQPAQKILSQMVDREAGLAAIQKLRQEM